MLTLKEFMDEGFKSRFDQDNPGDFEVKVSGQGKAGEKQKTYTIQKAKNEYHAQSLAMKKFKAEHPDHSEYHSTSPRDTKKIS